MQVVIIQTGNKGNLFRKLNKQLSNAWRRLLSLGDKKLYTVCVKIDLVQVYNCQLAGVHSALSDN